MPDLSNRRRILVDDPALAARVRAVLDGAYADALALMRWQHAAIEAALIGRRALDSGELAVIVACHPADDAAGDRLGGIIVTKRGPASGSR